MTRMEMTAIAPLAHLSPSIFSLAWVKTTSDWNCLAIPS